MMSMLQPLTCIRTHLLTIIRYVLGIKLSWRLDNELHKCKLKTCEPRRMQLSPRQTGSIWSQKDFQEFPHEFPLVELEFLNNIKCSKWGLKNQTLSKLNDLHIVGNISRKFIR